MGINQPLASRRYILARAVTSSTAGFFFAGAELFQFLARTGNLQALSLDGKAQPMRNLAFELFDLIAFELNNSFAIVADDVVVIGMIGVIRVVEFIIFSEIHLTDQPAFGQERQGAVHRRPRNRPVTQPGPFQQLFRGEMFLRAENRVDDGLTLRRDAQILLRQEVHELLLRAALAND